MVQERLRIAIKSNGSYEIWDSRQEEQEVTTLELHSLMWMPYTHCAQSSSLQAYLQALPGSHYRAKGTVVATDGSLRTHKHTSGEMSMGAGVASDDGATRISVRVGGQFSSTRAELAAIAIELWPLDL